MERLTIDEVIEHCNRQTERMENNFGRSQLEEKPMMGNLNIMKHYWEHRQVAKWLKELKEYRDLEEQGRLIVLPCKIGDTIYITGSRYRRGRIESWINTGKFRISDMEELGKHIFLTKEEAEKALEEMGGII